MPHSTSASSSSGTMSSSSTSSSPTSHTHSSNTHTHKKTPSHLSGFQAFLHSPQQQQYDAMPLTPLSPDQHLNIMTPTSRIVFDRDELEQGAGSAGFTEGQNATRGLLGSSLKPKHPRYHEERSRDDGREGKVKKSMKKMKSFFGLRKAGKYGS